ncbi:peptidoglycan editing factor PgeF [Nocardioides halotolerans]|uniref:peptidoglycan editing factor PgeF n=1 Tax=Nocardioides halotolerans TaxID=433660 RepID=UPI00040A20D6|nr:peptidoglycan editing factor PgeF [Nocardioides halotolerans]
MYSFRTTLVTSLGHADLAFTDRYGGVSASPYDELNLSVSGPDDESAKAENHRRLLADFAPGDVLRDLYQVHGADVVEAESVEGGGPYARPHADGIVTTQAGVVLMVRAADCVPVLLVAPDEEVVGAVHSGREGLVAGAAPAAVTRMRDLGADRVEAWVGPHVCGRCYEVPEDMRAHVAAVVPSSSSQTSWGTPSLDLGAGVRAQLEEVGVTVHDVGRCTLESEDLYSHRRDGERAGRLAGVVRLRGEGR